MLAKGDLAAEEVSTQLLAVADQVANVGMQTLREVFNALVGKLMQSSEFLSVADQYYAAELQNISPKTKDVTSFTELGKSASSHYNNIPHLVSLLKGLIKKYKDFHAQGEVSPQEIVILRSLARILDALRDIGMTGFDDEKADSPDVPDQKLRDQLMQLLETRADDQENTLLSLWANYAIQAVLRLDDKGSAVGALNTKHG